MGEEQQRELFELILLKFILECRLDYIGLEKDDVGEGYYF